MVISHHDLSTLTCCTPGYIFQLLSRKATDEIATHRPKMVGPGGAAAAFHAALMQDIPSRLGVLAPELAISRCDRLP